MRHKVALLLGMLFLPLALPAQEAFEIVRVADGVYAGIGRPTAPMPIGSNAAIIVNEDDVLVVDTHLAPSAARALLAEIKKLTDKPVRYVINTHWHNDHVQGNQAYFNVFPAPVEFISSHATREDIQKKAIPSVQGTLNSLPQQIAQAEQQLAAGVDAAGNRLTEEQKTERRAQIDRQKRYLEELRQIQITLPTVTFERSLVLHQDARDIHVLFFRKGHTRGDVVVWLPKDRVLVAGDLLTSQLPFPRDSYPSEWVETLEGMAKLEYDQIIPGHGPVQQGKDHLKLVTRVIGSIVEQVRAAVSRGLSLEDTKKAVNVEAFRQAVTGGEERFNAAFDQRVSGLTERAYWELTGKLTD
ncbi:MAG: MBL fold metallo-hydrolase [Acidobacteria bacterium]|nr:MBL fold metallo-hydrolase [Acidobacteriota bacterium]